MFARLRRNFQLSIIVLLGVSAILGILPFALFRLLNGELLVAALDTMVVLVISGAVAHAWWRNETRITGMFLVCFNTTAAVVIATQLGGAGLFWMYPTLLANFFLSNSRIAATASLLGVLALCLHGGAFSDDAPMLSFVATNSVLAAFAWIFARRTETQREQLRELASVDTLTGIGNRRTMEHSILRQLKAGARHGTRLALMVLDLDHFKKVNDEHGHDAGDELLCAFVERILQRKPQHAELFRYGGEEFVLVVPGAKLEQLQAQGEQLRQSVELEALPPGLHISVSIGAAIKRGDESWRDCLRRADQALYRAKAAGRNCVSVDIG